MVASLPNLHDAAASVVDGGPDPAFRAGLSLDPAAPAGLVVRSVLLDLLDSLEANVEGARANRDSEFLHDLRVANRRTRAILGQVQGVLPEPEASAFGARFAWVQRVTGPVRDLDVYLADLDEDCGRLPASLRAGLEPLRTHLQTQHADLQAGLAVVLDSVEFTDLLTQWRAFLQTPVPHDRMPQEAGRPIRSVMDARIKRIAKRVRRHGRAIDAASSPDELHQLRKTCKKLRYLMELFQGVYPRERLTPLLKQIKELLSELGAFQDLAVQARYLEDTAGHLYERAAGPGVLLGIGALISERFARQAEARQGFVSAFAGFEERRHWRAYKALFWSEGESAAS